MTKIRLDSLKSSNQVRNSLLGLYSQILDCPHFQQGCAPCIKKVSHPFGPEISFVGKHYGEGKVPRILFGRVSPNWPDVNMKSTPPGTSIQDPGWEMGNRLSIERYIEVNPSSVDDLFDALRDYWVRPRSHELYRGYRLFNTVTGKGNRTNISDPAGFLREPAKYGVEVILGEMKKAGILPPDGDLLDYCAINNLVKCAGGQRSGNFCKVMRRNCSEWYQQEMRRLSPVCIVFLGDKARDRDSRDEIRQAIGYEPLVLRLPHPAFRAHIWKKKHPPKAGSQWHDGEERQRYKDCLDLRDQVADAVEILKRQLRQATWEKGNGGEWHCRLPGKDFQCRDLQ